MPRSLCVFTAVLCLACHSAVGEVRYVDVPDAAVKGTWFQGSDGTIQVIDETLTLDLNLDAVADIQLSHGFVLEPVLISPEAVPYIHAAQSGISQIDVLLQEVRTIALDSANSGVNDTDQLALNQSMIDDRLNAIHHLATHAQFQGRTLLDGSSGLTGRASDNDILVHKVTTDTVPGSYDIHVVSPGERAAVEASIAQSQSLATDEILTINGVTVPLFAGLDQSDVINRINDFSSQTGLSATAASSGATRLYTQAAGTDAEIAIISNIASGSASSGFGTTERTDAGSDADVEIGGYAFHGNGATVLATNGDPHGLAITLGFAMPGDVPTVAGAQGLVTVADDSLVFSSDDGDTKLTLPDVRPSALAIGQPGNSFNSLSEIHVFSATSAQDSLALIDQAFDELRFEITQLNTLLDIVAPRGRNGAVGLEGTQLLMIDDEVVILVEGDPVGPTSTFWTGGNDLEYPATGYLGVEIPIDGNPHYGWLGVSTDFNGGIIIRDLAFETTPFVPISAGAVPEPNAMCLVWSIACLVPLGRRFRHRVS